VYGHANRTAGVTAMSETAGGFVATGEFTTSIDFGTQTLTTADDRPGLYVATFQSDGTPSHAFGLAATNDAEFEVVSPNGLTVASDGRVLVTAQFYGVVPLGSGLDSGPTVSGLVLVLDPSLNLLGYAFLPEASARGVAVTGSQLLLSGDISVGTSSVLGKPVNSAGGYDGWVASVPFQ
jgi:hypothetical protein